MTDCSGSKLRTRPFDPKRKSQVDPGKEGRQSIVAGLFRSAIDRARASSSFGKAHGF